MCGSTVLLSLLKVSSQRLRSPALPDHCGPCPATAVAGDILSHQIWGPRKKSWGLEMTIFNSIMRDTGRHSALVDIVSSFASLVSPSDQWKLIIVDRSNANGHWGLSSIPF